MQVNGYTQDLILELLKNADAYYETGVLAHEERESRSILGTLYQNAAQEDIISIEDASTKIGISAIDHSPLVQHSLQRDELFLQTKNIDNVVDILATSIIDRETFGNGRDLTETIASQIDSPFVGVSDEIFASQAAISEIFGFHQQLKGIEGHKIVLSWGFGSRFISPNLAHSLLLFLPLLGADVQVSAPSDFSLLNRVKREAENIASESGSTISFTDQFDSPSQDTAAVFAMNWSRLDDYLKPERNNEFAQKYRDWYFTQESLPAKCAFFSPLPIQTGLIADKKLLSQSSSIHEGWLKRRVATLACTFNKLLEQKNTTAPQKLL
ncbi:MAG: hypothetical protein ACW98Y_12380 [Candidatus Thorarchaeota archaeon]|jgi:ornithine carbamoyltransferase